MSGLSIEISLSPAAGVSHSRCIPLETVECKARGNGTNRPVGVLGDERLQDKTFKCKLMNLFTDPAVPHCTSTKRPLKGSVPARPLLECKGIGEISQVSNPNQGNGLQGTYKVNKNNGTMRYPKAILHGYGYGVVILATTSTAGVVRHYSVKTIVYESPTYSHEYKFAKDHSFNLGEGSPLIISKCGRTVSFSPLCPSLLIHAIAHMDVLLLAYELIKSKPGNMTKGATKFETLDGISMRWFHETSLKIKAGTFKFSPARRIMVPKVGKPGERFFPGELLNCLEEAPALRVMAPPREKIVQKAMAMVLTECFEPQFLDYSHGFRPKRNCHTALKLLDQSFRGATWVIEADLTKCFDRIPHARLLEILGRTILCSKTLALIKSSLLAGHVIMNTKVTDQIVGTPQGGILGPLLSNIFLHELDCEMHKLKELYTLRGSDKGENENSQSKAAFRRCQHLGTPTSEPQEVPEYSRLQSQIRNKRISNKEQNLIRRKLWGVPSKDPMDPHFQRLAYVRYADDFVISITGPLQRAVEVKEKVADFLKQRLDVELNEDAPRYCSASAKITKFNRGISFLGATISNRKIDEKPIKRMTAGPASGLLVRIPPRLTFHAPILKLMEKLVTRGYFRWSNSRATLCRIVPTAMRSLVNMDHRSILLLHNAVIRGILNYYSFADNRKSLGSLVHGLKMSCAHTLALKLKLRTVAKVFKSLGSRLRCKESGLEIYIPDTFARLPHSEKFNISLDSQTTPDSVIKLSYANK
jgi:retron-type reverse transcriptase